jgi:membrane protease YdiL (CAAX protease family)
MSRSLSFSTPLLLLLGLASSVGLRVAVGEPDVAGSQAGGVVFVAALALLLRAVAWKPGRVEPRSIFIGVAGAGVLVAGPAWIQVSSGWVQPVAPLSSYPGWAVLIVLIAGTEEMVLRGALFDACTQVAGPSGAVAVTAVAFALIHVPLYGAVALPLDLAVGMWLGGLRLLTGGVAAPATAHILADLCSWWLL